MDKGKRQRKKENAGKRKRGVGIGIKIMGLLLLLAITAISCVGVLVWTLQSVIGTSDQIVSEDIQSFIVGSEARGSGKNVEKGKALFQENGRQLFQTEYFINKCQEADVIFVVSATGGGTGPSVSPEICRVLTRMFAKKVIR